MYVGMCFTNNAQMARVDRASASEAVDSGFDSEPGQTNDLKKLVFTASLLDAQH